MKPYLFAIDLDGTLLYDLDTMSERMVAFIKSLQKEGHKIVIATGRPYRASDFIYDRLGLDTPIINYNGGLISHPNDDGFEEINITVDKDALIEIFDQNLSYIHNAFSEVRDAIYLYKDDETIRPFLHKTDDSPLYVGHFKDILDHDPNGALIMAEGNGGEMIKRYVDDHPDDEISARIWHVSKTYDAIVEVYPTKVNKGMALAKVAAYLKIPRERIIAFGDGQNDIEMIEYAKVGVAMKNAYPELRKKANLVLPHTSEEEGVRLFLQGFLGRTE